MRNFYNYLPKATPRIPNVDLKISIVGDEDSEKLERAFSDEDSETGRDKTHPKEVIHINRKYPTQSSYLLLILIPKFGFHGKERLGTFQKDFFCEARE